ncbi:MAG: MFS transporter [Emergencia sp.]
MENNRKRWFYLGVGTLLLIFCGLIYGWSLFREPFGQVYTTWTLSQLSMTFTISMTFFCLGGFAAGKLSAKLPPRVIIMMSAVLLLAGFFGVSRMNPQDPSGSLPMLYLCYGVLGGTGVGFSYNSVIGTMNKWFSDKPGTASGIMLMGFGLGALILGSVATSLISSQGIFRTFLILVLQFRCIDDRLIVYQSAGDTVRKSGISAGRRQDCRRNAEDILFLDFPDLVYCGKFSGTDGN